MQPEGLEVEAGVGLEGPGDRRGQHQGAQGIEAQAVGCIFDTGGFAGATEARRVGQAQNLGRNHRVKGYIARHAVDTGVGVVELHNQVLGDLGDGGQAVQLIEEALQIHEETPTVEPYKNNSQGSGFCSEFCEKLRF